MADYSKEEIKEAYKKIQKRRGPKLKGPTKEIEWEIFEQLLKFQCTIREVAAFFGVTTDTLQRRIEERYNAKFSDVFKQKRSGGFVSLRRAQFQKALSGNTAMLIWLGKQYLGQKDKIEAEGDNKVKFTITKAYDNDEL